MVICILWVKIFLFLFLPFRLEIIKSLQRFNRHLHAQCDITEGKCRQKWKQGNVCIPQRGKLSAKFYRFRCEKDCLIRRGCSFYNRQLFPLFAYQFFGTFLLSCLLFYNFLGLIFTFLFSVGCLDEDLLVMLVIVGWSLSKSNALLLLSNFMFLLFINK